MGDGSGQTYNNDFEKVVNFKIENDPVEKLPTVTFNTKEYYKEAKRLAKKPELLVDQETNPILKFVPSQ